MGIRTELNLRLPNSPGAAASVCQLLASERVNIIAMSLEATGHLHLLVDNHVRALGTLRDAHHRVEERDVLFLAVGSGPGGFAPVLKLLGSAGLNIDYAYGAEGSAGVVVAVESAQKAAAATGL